MPAPFVILPEGDKIAFTTQAGWVVNYFEFANTASNYSDALATANGLFGASAVAGVAKYAAFSYNAGNADNGDLTYDANENLSSSSLIPTVTALRMAP